VGEPDQDVEDFIHQSIRTLAADDPGRKLMTPEPEYLRITGPVAHALNKMSIGGYRHVLVDKALVPTGLITAGDIISYLVRFFPKSVLNLPAFPRANCARKREGA